MHYFSIIPPAGSVVSAMFHRYVLSRPSQRRSSTIYVSGESLVVNPPVEFFPMANLLRVFARSFSPHWLRANRHILLVSCWFGSFFRRMSLNFVFPFRNSQYF